MSDEDNIKDIIVSKLEPAEHPQKVLISQLTYGNYLLDQKLLNKILNWSESAHLLDLKINTDKLKNNIFITAVVWTNKSTILIDTNVFDEAQAVIIYKIPKEPEKIIRIEKPQYCFNCDHDYFDD